ncbi:MAG: rRNA maturation RNase YbeY [Pseudomonadales bacterium]
MWYATPWCSVLSTPTPQPMWNATRRVIKTSVMPAEILLDAELGLPDSVARHIEQAYEAAFSTGVDATAEVCIRVCDAAASRSLNQSFRQQDKPTNVLSFPADLSVEGVAILGDIALCWWSWPDRCSRP